MGTRHLICIVKDGDYKLAQYGQWDGYPSGQGAAIVKFLRKTNLDEFTRQVDFLQPATDEIIDKAYASCGADANEKWVTMDVAEKFSSEYPQFSRDTSAEILDIIQGAKQTVYTMLDLDFAADSLFCEWVYVINLDDGLLEVYKGYNKNPVPSGQRFSNMKQYEGPSGSKEYYPVTFLISYKLDELPTAGQFVKQCEELTGIEF